MAFQFLIFEAACLCEPCKKGHACLNPTGGTGNLQLFINSDEISKQLIYAETHNCYLFVLQLRFFYLLGRLN